MTPPAQADLLDAAVRAERTGAFPDAADHLRAAQTGPDPALALDAAVRLGHLLTRQGRDDLAEAAAVLDAALARAEADGFPRRGAGAPPPRPHRPPPRRPGRRARPARHLQPGHRPRRPDRGRRRPLVPLPRPLPSRPRRPPQRRTLPLPRPRPVPRREPSRRRRRGVRLARQPPRPPRQAAAGARVRRTGARRQARRRRPLRRGRHPRHDRPHPPPSRRLPSRRRGVPRGRRTRGTPRRRPRPGGGAERPRQRRPPRRRPRRRGRAPRRQPRRRPRCEERRVRAGRARPRPPRRRPPCRRGRRARPPRPPVRRPPEPADAPRLRRRGARALAAAAGETGAAERLLTAGVAGLRRQHAGLGTVPLLFDLRDLLHATGRTADAVRVMADALDALHQSGSERGVEEVERWLRTVDSPALTRLALGRYLPVHLIDDLLAGRLTDPPARRMTVTVLFTDLRGFTAMSAAMEPEAVVDVLNEWFGEATRVVRAHGGLVDKFVGDAVMALFGADGSAGAAAGAAVRAAVNLREELAALNLRNPYLKRPKLRIGVGVHTGDAVVGVMGSYLQRSFTAIGATVNTASRVEGATKQLDCDILITRTTRDAAGGTAETAYRDRVTLAGVPEPVEVYEVRGLREAEK